MISNIAIDALESCKKTLVKVLREELEKTPEHKINFEDPIFLSVGNSESVTGASSEYVNSVAIEDGNIIVYAEDYYNEYKADISHYTIDEVSSIIDAL